MEAGRHPHDRQLADLVGELTLRSPEFPGWSNRAHRRVSPCGYSAAGSVIRRPPVLTRAGFRRRRSSLRWGRRDPIHDAHRGAVHRGSCQVK
ncbi:hypothetical protein [Candidatus Frankia alpina]|uniref:MmyB family transcriptional regulator n=1 Tax=Candidatus Frankia alpina TaxID=2699483 RepID=UPI002E261D4C